MNALHPKQSISTAGMHVSNMAILASPVETEQMRGESSSPSAHQSEPTSAFYPEGKYSGLCTATSQLHSQTIKIGTRTIPRILDVESRTDNQSGCRFRGPERPADATSSFFPAIHPVVDGRVARAKPERYHIFFALASVFLQQHIPVSISTTTGDKTSHRRTRRRGSASVAPRFVCNSAMNNSTSTVQITSWWASRRGLAQISCSRRQDCELVVCAGAIRGG